MMQLDTSAFKPIMQAFYISAGKVWIHVNSMTSMDVQKETAKSRQQKEESKEEGGLFQKLKKFSRELKPNEPHLTIYI
jgi:hypothetical protein